MGPISSQLSKPEVQQLLGVNAFGMWRLVRKYEDFPDPEKQVHAPATSFDSEVWDASRMYRWAARTPEFAHRGAVLLRPLPEGLAPGRWSGYTATARGPALDWQTQLGLIRFVHSAREGVASDVAAAVAETGNPEGVVSVCALFGDVARTGPDVVAADTARPEIEYEARWGDIATLAGHDLPWWPHALRLPQLIREWCPDAPVAVVELPSKSSEKALRRAADNASFDDDSRMAVTDMANKIRNARTNSTSRESETFGQPGYRGEPNRIVIAAAPDVSNHPLPTGEDLETVKAGWHKIALSAHPDAVAALEVAVSREPHLLPFGSVTTTPVQSGTAAERWARRLTLCDPTAAHAVLADNDSVDAFYLDPLTDMPALRTVSRRGEPVWRYYAPLSLPAGDAEVASVILQHRLWITTSDGHVHPAPCTPTEHLWWGDGWGDRPSEAAVVVSTLLDDLGADIDLDQHWGTAPKGLVALFNEEHEHGTELPRSTLLHARMTPPRTT